jgi:hypothetical protein
MEKTETKISKREKLLGQYIKLQNDAAKINNAIRRIDALSQRRVHNKMVGKCYETDCEIVKVDKYDYNDLRYKGTSIYDFGEGPCEVKFNNWIFEDRIKQENEVPEAKFRKALRQIKLHLKKV